ncbi:hypothetical protein CC86DRAFT_403625 [Ophiobolus disseminans]|uniref:Uncharacterized protein n=1 Tax=Ophiobolus disseminans TaxID=1469910 RepID=A0A6A7A6Q0_9PLEO|nr:hypothetical protein CC86DRAFT_403625 [Ophiobolus disseminans]
MVQTLVQCFFAEAEVTLGVTLERKNWFRDLEMACRLVGEGIRVLAAGVAGDEEVEEEEGGYEGGDGAGRVPGMQEKKTARIAQRIFWMTKRANKDWAKHVGKELRKA